MNEDSVDSGGRVATTNIEESSSNRNVNGTSTSKDSKCLSSDVSDNTTSQEEELLQACKKTCFLDGEYFTVDIKKSLADKKIYGSCTRCNITIQGSLKTSSNYVRHLKNIHGEDIVQEYKKYKNEKLSRSNDPSDKIHRRVTCRFSQEKFEENIINCILKNQLPVRIVEDSAFRQMFDELRIKNGDRPLKHLTRYTAMKRIDKAYYTLIKDIKISIKNVDYVCTTCDIWTSNKRRFLGLTVHWINPLSLKRHSAAIACRKLTGTISFDVLANEISEIHSLFGLTNEKVIATVTDNGSNFVKAFRLFGISSFTKFFRENLEVSSNERVDVDASSSDSEQVTDSNTDVDSSCDGNYDDEEEESYIDDDDEVEEEEDDDNNTLLSHHLRCGSHTMSLIGTTDTINAINSSPTIKALHKNVIDKCEKLWKSLRSPKNREKLEKYLNCCLKRPVITRWNSLYESLKQIYTLREKLSSYELLRIIKELTIFTAKDFEYIADYLKWSEPLAKAINMLQGEDNIFYGFLLPTILQLNKIWQTLLLKNSLKFSSVLVDKLIVKLRDRFEPFFNITDQGEFAALAAITHPKFKLFWIDLLNPPLQNKVRELANSLMQKTSANNPAEPTITEKSDDFFDFGDTSRNQFISSQNPENNQFSLFFLDTDKTLNCLHKYPEVKKYFIKFNTVLPSSGPVERFFSYVTQLDEPKNNRLSDIEFEKRVICKANAKNKY